MPYMQRRRLTTVADISGSSTWRYKLPAIGKFAAIEIVLDCQRANARTLNTVVYPLETQVTKVELLEGSTRPLVSLTGEQLDAANYWTLQRPNARRYRQEDATGNIMTWFLTGGRGMYDREFGYDFAKLGETYLEFTHALTADATDKFDVSTSVLTLYAWQWMDAAAVNFKGYFRDRQLAYWTTSAADTLKTIEIPVGRPIRRIALQAGTRASTIGGTIKELEVVVNDGEYSPVHIKSPMHHVMAELSEYDLDNQIGGLEYLVASTTMDLPYWWSYMQTIGAQRYGASGQPVINTHGITVPFRLQATSAVAGEVIFTTRGWGFQKCLRIGFDHEADGLDLLPTAGLGALDLICTENAASLAARVFVQDVITY